MLVANALRWFGHGMAQMIFQVLGATFSTPATNTD
jgi:hypothetical protein